MDYKFRFSIMAAVSSTPQAGEDRLSLPDQIKTARAAGVAQGGVETAGPFTLDGYSRTGYINLSDALTDIPPLKDAMDSAERDEYDVLIVDNIERFGDLAPMVYTLFGRYKKQIHSARQATPIHAPEDYEPSADESSNIMMHVEGIIQSYRIRKIRRGWNIGVPARASKGLHPLASLPFGYRKTVRDKPAEQVPEEVALIKQMVTMYLAGKTLQQIVDHCNATHKPRRAEQWKITVVKRIILNRYYAGITTFGRMKTVDKKRIPNPPSTWVSGQGQHVPIYDEATYSAILAETERRDAMRSRVQTYTLSGIVSCSVCGSRLHRHGKLGTPYPVDLSCPQGHINIYYDIALKLVANTFVKALRDYVDNPQPHDDAERLAMELQALEEKRTLIQEGYEAKIYSKSDASQKIHEIEIEKDRLTRQYERTSQQQEYRDRLLEFARTNDLAEFGESILHDDPTEINHLLGALCETIVITPRYEMQVRWR